jgi:predicted DNA-binding WGR domain protein
MEKRIEVGRRGKAGRKMVHVGRADHGDSESAVMAVQRKVRARGSSGFTDKGKGVLIIPLRGITSILTGKTFMI